MEVPIFKNVASQKIALRAWDTATSLPKTGDAANITAYVNKDWAGVNVLGDTSATELSSTNAPGWYVFDLTQAETNADTLHFTGKSSTSGIVIVDQGPIQTFPASLATVSDIPTAAQNADGLLGRNIAGGSSTGRIVSEALYALRNKWRISSGTRTVYQTDDVTASFTSVVTSTPGGLPITGDDPN